jgi:hypothetical protein
MHNADNDDEWMEQGRSLKKKTQDSGCFFASLGILMVFLVFYFLIKQ